MDEIGRLRIVCVADRRRSGAALAVRSRLERVARSELGRALDGQVARDAQVRLGRLAVRLDLDPDDYDDRTLAILWAGRIREAIVAATSPSAATTAGASSADAVPSPEEHGNERSHAAIEVPVQGLARRAIRGDMAAATAVARAVLADPAGVVRELRQALSAPERRALVRTLEARGSTPRWRGAHSFASATTARRRSAGKRSEPRMALQLGARIALAGRLTIAARRWLASQSGGATIGMVTPRTKVPARPMPARHGVATPADLRLVSQVAGLGLLWPWLTAQLEAASDRLPGLDPVGARRLALAALVAGMPAAVDDPVIRLLAGDDLSTDPSLIVVSDGELLLAAEGAAVVLEAFAAALPGFADSTLDFVRREFLVRAGVVNPAVDPVMVTAAPLPLDPALSRLRYPIGAFRLPWTRPIALRLGHA